MRARQSLVAGLRSTFTKLVDWPRLRALLQREEMRPAWLVGVVSLAATLLFWHYVVRDDQRAAAAEFDGVSQRVIGEIERTMSAYEQVLRSGAGLFGTRLQVSRDDWRAFVGALDIVNRYPGARGVGYAVLIPRGDLGQHETTLRQVHGETYAVRPSGARDVYSSIIYLEPEDERNLRAIGYDMYSETQRRAAMDRARDSGVMAASARVRLVQEYEEENPQAGILIYLPVYRAGEAASTLDERRRALQGFIYSPIRMGDFIGGLLDGPLASVRGLVRIELFDGPKPDPANLMFDSRAGAKPRSAAFVNTTLLEEAGRVWLMRFSSEHAFEASARSRGPLLALCIGLLLSGLLTALTTSLAARHVEAAEANAQMALLTRELSHRVKNTLAIVQSIANRSLSDDRTIKEGRDIFGKRLHALARAHTFLLNNAWSGADLRDLVTSELAAFGARATISGPSVRLKPQLAQTFALVIHELATNAVKHGSLSTPEGRVAVSWSILKGANPASFRLSWREFGGPPVRPPSRLGFGQTLLKQAVVHGSAKEPEIVFAEDGFQYRFEVPLATALVEDTDDANPLV